MRGQCSFRGSLGLNSSPYYYHAELGSNNNRICKLRENKSKTRKHTITKSNHKQPQNQSSFTAILLIISLFLSVTIQVAESQFINEFEPNPIGSDPQNALLELKGLVPGTSFTGCFLSIDGDTDTLRVDHTFQITSSMAGNLANADGIVSLSITDIENPSNILVLTGGAICPVSVGDGGASIPGLTSSNVLDAIGVPDSMEDVSRCQPSRIDPSLSVYPSFSRSGNLEAELIFRDGFSNVWYEKRPFVNTEVYTVEGNPIAVTQFNSGSNPLVSTFGVANPTSFLSTPILNEFEPNPVGSDPEFQSIELFSQVSAGTVPFTGCIATVECDLISPNLVDRATSFTGNFDSNGLLQVTVPDFENPSFILLLLAGECPAIGSTSQTTIIPGNVLDAIGIPDSSFDVEGCRPSVINSELTRFDLQTTTGTDEPDLVFRDGVTREWYEVNAVPRQVLNRDGVVIPTTDFVSGGNPRVPTFGQTNPSIEERITSEPSSVPSQSPSNTPSISVQPSTIPSISPSVSFTPSAIPSGTPSNQPSRSPSLSSSPSQYPSTSPSESQIPSFMPSLRPSVSHIPSSLPSKSPSVSSIPSQHPSTSPSVSQSPSFMPSLRPSVSHIPSSLPSKSPSVSSSPSEQPSLSPSLSSQPSFLRPSEQPSASPSVSSQPSITGKRPKKSDKEEKSSKKKKKEKNSKKKKINGKSAKESEKEAKSMEEESEEKDRTQGGTAAGNDDDESEYILYRNLSITAGSALASVLISFQAKRRRQYRLSSSLGKNQDGHNGRGKFDIHEEEPQKKRLNHVTFSVSSMGSADPLDSDGGY